jgi:hypothetical protein
MDAGTTFLLSAGDIHLWIIISDPKEVLAGRPRSAPCNRRHQSDPTTTPKRFRAGGLVFEQRHDDVRIQMVSQLNTSSASGIRGCRRPSSQPRHRDERPSAL